MLFNLIVKGVVTGLILSIMLGPAFFLLLETSIKKGIRASLAFDAGVLTGDIIYICVAFLFIQQVEELSFGQSSALIRLIGGILFLGYGLYTYRKEVKSMDVKKSWGIDPNMKDYWKLYIKGLLLNLANPLIVLYWFGIISFGHSGSKLVLSGFEMFLFLVFVLGTFFTVDVIKIVGAKRLRPFITEKFLNSLNKIIGVILMAFGGFLIVNSIILWLR